MSARQEIGGVAAWLRAGAGTPPPLPRRGARKQRQHRQDEEEEPVAARKRTTLREAAEESTRGAEAETASPAPAEGGDVKETGSKSPGKPRPARAQTTGLESDADAEERVRMTVYLPLSAWEVVEDVALARKRARGGRGHASASKVIEDLVTENLGALEAEAATRRRRR